MGKYKIQKEGKTLWIQNLDNVNGTLTFTDKKEDAYDKTEGDYYMKAEADFIKFHYKNDYPEVETLVAELWGGWTYKDGTTYPPEKQDVLF